MEKTSLIITSIASPNEVLNAYALGAKERNINYVVIGDTKSPSDFKLSGCDFWSVDRQLEESNSLFAKNAPFRHYARKNLGYILAKRNGSEWIIETDDDNFPYDTFWGDRQLKMKGKIAREKGWINAYRYFSDKNIWPRGFALEHVLDEFDFSGLETEELFCPIQQGLADDNPDVDAIYRLILPLPFKFESKEWPIALARGSWCPFNSQNTSWHRSAFLLTYLPSFCSFRMTDIWRSFVAQRIAWENEWHLLFHNATVYQQRNEHNILHDFEDEISGYLNNGSICEKLNNLPLKSGENHIPENLIICYEELIKNDFIDKKELPLLECWIEDMA